MLVKLLGRWSESGQDLNQSLILTSLVRSLKVWKSLRSSMQSFQMMTIDFSGHLNHCTVSIICAINKFGKEINTVNSTSYVKSKVHCPLLIE